MAKNNPLTPEIIIETLKRSNLQTVLIEGKDDLFIYRQMEEDLEFLDVDFFPCSGRSTLLEVYKSRNEINSKLLFICDKDLWLFVPSPEYLQEDIITTEGYSIENELYQDGVDIINSLLSKSELIKKKQIIDNLCVWFAHEVSLVLANEQHDCKFSDVTILNTQVIETNSTTFTDFFLKSRNFQKPDEAISVEIKNEYQRKLRGKFIFQVFEKIFQERSKQLVKYKRDQLFDIIYRTVTNLEDGNKILNIRKQQIVDYFTV